MKILLLSLFSGCCPQFETELELIYKHLENNDDVYVLTCSGVLSSCYFNIDNLYSKCFICKKRFAEGIRGLDKSKINIIKLDPNIYSKYLKKVPTCFEDIEKLKEYEIFGIDFGQAVACSLISILRDHKLDTRLARRKVHNALRSSIIVYNNANYFINKIKPNIVYIHNGRFANMRPVVRLCDRLGIKFCTYDMDLSSYVITKNYLPHDLENIKKEIQYLWNKSSISDLDKQAFARSWFKLQSKNLFTGNQKNHCLPECFDSSKRNIVIFNSSLDEMETFPEWKKGFIYKSENDAIESIVRSFFYDKSIKFYLRIHPNLKDLDNTQIRDLKELEKLSLKNLEIIWPEDNVDSYALMDACEKTIVFVSTMGLEACYRGKPSILLSRAYYEDLDCCYIPKNEKEVIDLINDFNLVPKNPNNALMYGFWVLSRRRKFKRFNGKDLTFCGKKIDVNRTFANNLKFRFYNYLDRFRRFIKQID